MTKIFFYFLFAQDYLALQQYQDLLDKVLGEIFLVMKSEAATESDTSVVSTLLDISSNVKSLTMRIKSIIQVRAHIFRSKTFFVLFSRLLFKK